MRPPTLLYRFDVWHKMTLINCFPASGGFLDPNRRISSLGRLSKGSSTQLTSSATSANIQKPAAAFTPNNIPSARLPFAGWFMYSLSFGLLRYWGCFYESLLFAVGTALSWYVLTVGCSWRPEWFIISWQEHLDYWKLSTCRISFM